MLHSRKNSGVTRFLVASSATCLAPFSQNSACERSPSGSGQAHPGQSNPVFWLSFSNVRTPRVTPISFQAAFAVATIEGIPPATLLTGRIWTRVRSSGGWAPGGDVLVSGLDTYLLTGSSNEQILVDAPMWFNRAVMWPGAVKRFVGTAGAPARHEREARK